jgi:hypothetical protein
MLASKREISEHVELPHEVDMVIQAHRLAVGGMGSKLMVEDMSHIHAGMPERRSFDGSMRQAAIIVDLAKFVVAVELIDRSQLAAPPVREVKGHIVKVHADCW